MWAVETVDVFAGDLDAHGIRPRDPAGLEGIATAPFLHAGFGHLLGNTLPFVVMGAVIALAGLARVAAVTAIVALVSGLGTWVVAASNTVHVGASGIVFGYAAYLLRAASSAGDRCISAWARSCSGSTAPRCCSACGRRRGSPGRGISSARSAACSPLECSMPAASARWRRRHTRRHEAPRHDLAGPIRVRRPAAGPARRHGHRSHEFVGLDYFGLVPFFVIAGATVRPDAHSHGDDVHVVAIHVEVPEELEEAFFQTLPELLEDAYAEED
jgi:hypothetical protein